MEQTGFSDLIVHDVDVMMSGVVEEGFMVYYIDCLQQHIQYGLSLPHMGIARDLSSVHSASLSLTLLLCPTAFS